MKIYTEGWLHHKNRIGLDLLKKYIKIDQIYNKIEKYDAVFSFNQIKSFEEKTVYGPHIMFPDIDDNYIFNDLQLFNCLSPWLEKLVSTIKPNLNCISIPFPVDIDKFKPQHKTGLPVIYYKNVDKKKIDVAKNLIGGNYEFFDYSNKYQEDVFLNAISKAPYAIWVGCHESQGFAFQETLSCNTPIFVLDVNSLRDEVNSVWTSYVSNNELTATSASYFDDSCGKIFKTGNIDEEFNDFIQKLNHYQPRDFIVSHLSAKACYELWTKKIL